MSKALYEVIARGENSVAGTLMSRHARFDRAMATARQYCRLDVDHPVVEVQRDGFVIARIRPRKSRA